MRGVTINDYHFPLHLLVCASKAYEWKMHSKPTNTSLMCSFQVHIYMVELVIIKTKYFLNLYWIMLWYDI